MSERLGIKATFKKGLRVTDEKTMEVVKMVLTGKVNPDLVAGINRLGGQAVGHERRGRAEHHRRASRASRSGFVGRVTQVNKEPITALLGRGYIPVIASIGLGYDGHAYNINADTVAAEIAVALEPRKLILLTDVPGVLGVDGEVVAVLSKDDARQRIDAGRGHRRHDPEARGLPAGAGRRARSRTSSTAATPHALLLELFTEAGIGTMVTP